MLGSRDTPMKYIWQSPCPLGKCVLEGYIVSNKYTSGCQECPEDKVRVDSAEWVFSHRSQRVIPYEQRSGRGLPHRRAIKAKVPLLTHATPRKASRVGPGVGRTEVVGMIGWDLQWGLSKGSLIQWQSLNRRGVQLEYSHNRIPCLDRTL